jgi:hypothetical protein
MKPTNRKKAGSGHRNCGFLGRRSHDSLAIRDDRRRVRLQGHAEKALVLGFAKTADPFQFPVLCFDFRLQKTRIDHGETAAVKTRSFRGASVQALRGGKTAHAGGEHQERRGSSEDISSRKQLP